MRTIDIRDPPHRLAGCGADRLGGPRRASRGGHGDVPAVQPVAPQLLRRLLRQRWVPGGRLELGPWRARLAGISWNDPSYREWFATSEDGQWIVLDGWRSHGDYYTLRTKREWYGRYDCTGMVPFKPGKDEGRQHYAKVDVAGPRCLIAEGEITEASTGRIIEFRHEQRWSAPFRCTTRYYTNRRCISQLERWYDDNGHPFQLVEDRIVYLAKGLGMAFWVKDHRVNWRVSGKDYR